MRQLVLVLSVVVLFGARLAFGVDDRPNILWITSEDNGPHLGCYGDPDADTPNLDALAARGMIYLNCWSNAPVCAPARTTIISGLYPTATGAQHQRTMTSLPAGMRMFPQDLRAAGYYCTNNAKEDYNLRKPGQIWDASGGRAHWRNRPADTPFFAVFNIGVTHESQIRRRPHTPVHDPAGVRLPAYHPDLEPVRRDWAQYHDKMTAMDRRVGRILGQLEEDGLADRTIVFYFGDHGPGLPRCKRSAQHSGLHVPLIVHVPPAFATLAPADYVVGGRSDRLVGFIDLAPTMLSLASIKIPSHLHGHAFMGHTVSAPPRYLHGFGDRMDERYDMQRSVRDSRYVYVRNYMPHLPDGQHVEYMFRTPTTQAWKEAFDSRTLPAAQRAYWEPKPPEALYDLETDPDELVNLAGEPAYAPILSRLRAEQRAHARRMRDLGFLPEDEIHARAEGSSPYEMARDYTRYRFERVMGVAEVASLGTATPKQLGAALTDADSAVRYWAALGMLMRGRAAVMEQADALRRAMSDEAPSVRVAAAHALARHGPEAGRRKALAVLVDAGHLERNGVYVAKQALNALDDLDQRAAPMSEAIRALPRDDPSAPRRALQQFGQLIDKVLADLDADG